MPDATVKAALALLVRRNLAGVWVRGTLPRGGCVWSSNHHSWWDFFVAAAALRSIARTDVGVLMQPGNIGRPQLFRRVGVVGTDRLRTAASMVASGMVLVVFPEGELRNPGVLGPTRAGDQWIAASAGATVQVAATRVVLRGRQAPEAYVDLGPRLAPGGGSDDALRDRLTALDGELARADPNLPLAGFTRVTRGVTSWHERFSALRGPG